MTFFLFKSSTEINTHLNFTYRTEKLKMKFDDIVKQLGEFGTYQKRQYFLLCIPSVLAGFHMVMSVFLLATPKHRCAIPNYPNDTYEVQSEYHKILINMTIPPPTDKLLEYSQCKIYDETDMRSNRTKQSCTSWVYDTTVFKSSFTKEQNLVCDDELKTSHSQMIYFAGVLVGAVGLGALSDWIGRKKTLYLSGILLTGSTLGVAWAPEFISFVILRFFVGVACAGIFMTSFVLGMELVGPSKRLWAGVVIEYFFAIGLVILGFVGLGVRHWKYIEIICSVPCAFLLIYWWIVPESPRWLVSQGRFDEANAIIERAAKINKVYLPKNVLDKDSFDNPPPGRLWHLFASHVLLQRTLIIFFNWMVVSMVYYGLSLNTGNLGGDFYLNFLLSGLVEFPAYTLCLVLLDRVGRKILHASCMILGGLACILTLFPMIYADESLQPITVTLAMLGKLGIAAAFAVIYVWSAEIYPTVVRNAGMGASSSCARVGGMVAPYIADLSKVVEGNFGRALPLIVFGGASVLAGILSIYLPETRHQHLPETIEDGIKFKGAGKSSSKNKYVMNEGYQNEGFENTKEDNTGTFKKKDSLS